jgi:hypothetical protein
MPSPSNATTTQHHGKSIPLLLLSIGILILLTQVALFILFSPSKAILAQPPQKAAGNAPDKQAVAEVGAKNETNSNSSFRLEMAPQDVSSIFTYHLTALGLMFVVATILLAAQQINAQKEEAKRNEARAKEQKDREEAQRIKTEAWQEEQRHREIAQQEKTQAWHEQQAARDTAQDKRADEQDKIHRQIMTNTANLIGNMAGVMGSTEKALAAANTAAETWKKLETEKTEAKERIRNEAKVFIKTYSLNDPIFALAVDGAHSRAAPDIPKIPSAEQPVEYKILNALFIGCAQGLSQAAYGLLENAVTEGTVPDDDLRARTHYFRGHFALRTGRFETAREQFVLGQALKKTNDSYRLFALYAELMELRRTNAIVADDRIRAAFADYWTEKVRAGKKPDVREAVLPYFWEHLGHAFAALLVEGLCAQNDPLLGDPAEAKQRFELGFAVAQQAAWGEENSTFGKNPRYDSPAFDAVKFEVGVRLARLPAPFRDPSKLMTADELRKVVGKCRTAARSTDARAKIIYATRLARFTGRWAAALPEGSPEQLAAAEEMTRRKEEAIQALESFKVTTDATEHVYSVFTNQYQRPELIVAALDDEARLDKYREERLPPSA